MARADLAALRAALIDTGFLTRAEMGALTYWHEDKLTATLEMFGAIAEVESEFEELSDEDAYIRPHLRGPDYDDEFDDGFDEYEYEVIIEGGNTRSPLGT